MLIRTDPIEPHQCGCGSLRRLRTLDILSAGGLRVGFGIGWSPDEYEAAGVTWQERGKRADELIQALKKMLGSLRRAMKPTSRLILVENVIPEGASFYFGKWTDLEMLVVGGRERTEREYRALLTAAGFDLQEVVATHSPLSLLVAKTRGRPGFRLSNLAYLSNSRDLKK